MIKALLPLLLVAVLAQSDIVHEDNEPILQVNWKGLLQCLKDAAPVAKDVVELIRFIKAKQYFQATGLTWKLIKSGVQIVKQCIGYLKKSSTNAINYKWIRPFKSFNYNNKSYRVVNESKVTNYVDFLVDEIFDFIN